MGEIKKYDRKIRTRIWARILGMGYYIPFTLQKFRPQNFDEGKMNTEKIGTRIILIKIWINEGNTYKLTKQ